MTYQNFYLRDVRTPSTYYEDKDLSLNASTELTQEKLDALITALDTLRTKSIKSRTSPAYKKIVDKELEKANLKRYQLMSKQNARQVIEAFTNGTPEDAVDAITHALEYKIFCRTEPFMMKAGKEIENEVFGKS